MIGERILVKQLFTGRKKKPCHVCTRRISSSFLVPNPDDHVRSSIVICPYDKIYSFTRMPATRTKKRNECRFQSLEFFIWRFFFFFSFRKRRRTANKLCRTRRAVRQSTDVSELLHTGSPFSFKIYKVYGTRPVWYRIRPRT